MLSAVYNNEVPLPLLDTPVGDMMLSKHNGKDCNTLQDGMDVAFSFPKVCFVLLGTLGVSLDLFLQGEGTESSNSNILQKLLDNNIICLQLVHCKDEFLQALQVLASRFRLFDTLFPERKCWRIGYLH